MNAETVSGDRAMFARLVDEHRTAVCSVALAIVGDVPTSEDVAQDVFVAAWTGLHRLRNPASVGPWLRQVTRNRAVDRVRRRTREVATDPSEQAETAVASDDAEAAALGVERERIVRATLDALPDDTREVVLLFYREGQSIRRVAALLELSEAAVKKRLSRARATMRSDVAERFAEHVRDSAPKAAFTAAVMIAVSVGAPTVASAAGVAAGASKAAKAFAWGPALAGPLLGIGGVLAGMRVPMRRARTDAERRALRRVTVAAIVHIAVWAAVVPRLRGHPVGLWTWFALLIGGFAAIHLVWVRRIIAPRQAAERREDPTAAARQRMEHRLGYLGLIGGAVAGGIAIALASTM